MRRIGLTGGIASGKSFVAQQLHALGAHVLDADRIGHEVLCLPEVQRAISERWGAEVFREGGVDRGRLAKIVFAPGDRPHAELKYLESITHPEIKRRLMAEATACEFSGKMPALVLDVPVLLEAGWDKLCDLLLFVDCPRPVRLARAVARGWNQEGFAARESAQLPLDIKRQRADLIVDNSISAESTKAQVEQIWQRHVSCTGEPT